MQQHNMVIPSQAEEKSLGVCRDYTGAILDKDEERVQSHMKIWGQLDETAFRFVFRVNPSAPYAGNSITKQFPKRGNLNPEMDMAIPCQAAINYSQACVETIQEPTYFD